MPNVIFFVIKQQYLHCTYNVLLTITHAPAISQKFFFDIYEEIKNSRCSKSLSIEDGYCCIESLLELILFMDDIYAVLFWIAD